MGAEAGDKWFVKRVLSCPFWCFCFRAGLGGVFDCLFFLDKFGFFIYKYPVDLFGLCIFGLIWHHLSTIFQAAIGVVVLKTWVDLGI